MESTTYVARIQFDKSERHGLIIRKKGKGFDQHIAFVSDIRDEETRNQIEDSLEKGGMKVTRTDWIDAVADPTLV